MADEVSITSLKLLYKTQTVGKYRKEINRFVHTEQHTATGFSLASLQIYICFFSFMSLRTIQYSDSALRAVFSRLFVLYV